MNEFTYECECKSGYKFDHITNTCKKCYTYENGCLIHCPKNTVLNDKEYICENIGFNMIDYINLYWVSCIVSLFVILVIGIVALFSFKKMV